jgi:ferrous iron transport protein B
MGAFSMGEKVVRLNEVLADRPAGVPMEEYVATLTPEQVAAHPIVAEYVGLLEQKAADDERIALEAAGVQLRQSILGRIGQAIEPVVEPLGWDWKIGMAVVASFPAREVVIATLGVIYDVGEADEESADLREKLIAARHADGTPVFTLPVALGIMVFFALCAQCAATIAIIWRETNTWKWAAFSFTYMTVLAYIGAFFTFHIANRLL